MFLLGTYLIYPSVSTTLFQVLRFEATVFDCARASRHAGRICDAAFTCFLQSRISMDSKLKLSNPRSGLQGIVELWETS